MNSIFDARTSAGSIDFTDHAAAVAHVEAAGSGSIVSFYLVPNMAGRLPELIHTSFASETCEDGAWRTNFIF